MVLPLLLALVSTVQPTCTTAQFHQSLDPVLLGEHEIIATVIFDDYLEQVQQLTIDEKPSRYSKRVEFDAQLKRSNQADILFDGLLASLFVLSEETAWERGVMNLRRTVLLQARLMSNPWPATVWVDLPNIIPTSGDEIIRAINTFLIDNIDSDRQDRFNALGAILDGDTEACITIERKAMKRWGEYQELIAPYINGNVRSFVYPQLDRGDQVHKIVEWISTHIQDENVIKATQHQYVIWETLRNKQITEVIALVRRARLDFGFDPWSGGCGISNNREASKIKNNLLRLSAMVRELHRSTVNSILTQLTPEQVQLFEDQQ